MQEMNSPEITRLAKALLAVQRELSPASKDATNPFTRSRYATLNSVMEACREALLTHGIWLTQLPVPAPPELGPGHIGLLTKLTHAESGQWQGSLTVVPLPKADPQGMGSAITYALRYALTAMLGMITEDDDGESARPARKPRPTANCLPAPRRNHGLRNGAEHEQPAHKQEKRAGRRTPPIRCRHWRGLPTSGSRRRTDVPASWRRAIPRPAGKS